MIIILSNKQTLFPRRSVSAFDQFYLSDVPISIVLRTICLS